MFEEFPLKRQNVSTKMRLKFNFTDKDFKKVPYNAMNVTYFYLFSGLNMSRIYPECQTLTATGRVSLHEPSIQNVPNDFEVVATPQLLKKALGNTFPAKLISNFYCLKRRGFVSLL